MKENQEANPPATVANAEGVGDVFKQTNEFIRDHLIPTIVEVIEPETGVKVLATLGDDGVVPLGASVFDGARPNPMFRRGTAAMTSLASFMDHVNRFGDTDTAVFADDSKTSPKLTAVLDYHRADNEDAHGEYRHGKHRTTFTFPLSEEWKAWTKANGTVMSMGQFALFLEDRIGDIAVAGDEFPEDITRFVNVNGGADSIADFATLVELSRGLKVFEQANVEEATNLASGEGHIRFSVEHETRTKTGGTIKVPTMFFIAIPVFAKGPFYRIGARLRYRKTPEGVKFWFDLYRADRSFDHAFTEAVDTVQTKTSAFVFFGSPEA